MSFNSRIYSVSVEVPSPSISGLRAESKHLVLKVNGRFFGAHKIQNEVACLGILERYCPELPVPRVIAWSEHGSGIQTSVTSEGDSHVQFTLSREATTSSQSPGWILMTRLPGEPFSSPDTGRDEIAMASIGRQLAEIVACLRKKVPPLCHCGNVLIRPRDLEDDMVSADKGLGLNVPGLTGGTQGLVVRGLLGDGIPPSTPIRSVLELHQVRFRAKLRELETDDTYAPNSESVPLIFNFITKTLPSLISNIDNSAPEFIFTHYDLSPRNTLLSFPEPTSDNVGNAAPKITGILDFEFPGFFPPAHEFVNDYVDNGGDWSEKVYSSYLTRLEELGIPTPRKGIDDRLWKLEHRLGVLLDNIAPWWLPGGLDRDALEAKLSECRGVVESCVKELGAA